MSTSNVTTKVCHQCHLEKPTYEFHKHSRNKDGLRNNCKQCRADNGECNYVKPAPPGFQYCRKCNVLHPASLEYFYWDKTKNKFYSYCKPCHYLMTRSWQKRNYEFWMGRNRNWMIAHPDKMKASNKKWCENNPERYAVIKAKGIADLRQREIDNPDWAKANSKKAKARRRARILNSPGSHTSADILLQRKAQTDKKGRLHCWWCGKIIKDEDYHLDHVIPLSRGGSNGADNIVLSCPKCNLAKSAKNPQEFAGRLIQVTTLTLPTKGVIITFI